MSAFSFVRAVGLGLTAFLLLAIHPMLSGCRGTTPNNEQSTESTPDGSGNEQPTPDTPPNDQSEPEKPQPTGLRVIDLQNPASPNRPAERAPVILKGVVVTSQLFVLDRQDGQVTINGFFVSDADFPDKWGGILVSVGADFTTRLDLGDVIDIEGTYQEFFNNSRIDARVASGGRVIKTNENKKAAIKAIPVTAADVPAIPVDDKNPDDSKAEPYEGVLVELKDVTVAEAPDEFGVWKIEGGAEVDDTFYRVQPKKGDKLSFVRGIVHFAFGKFTVLPRGALDVEGGKPGCQSETDCNRGSRCLPDIQQCQVVICGADTDCATGETCNPTRMRCEAPQAGDLKLADIQDPSSSKYPRRGDVVEVKGVLVSTQIYDVSANLKGFFVADPSANKWGGLQITVSKEFAESLAVGDVVDIKGRVEEYFGNTQINAQPSVGGDVKKTGANQLDQLKPVVVPVAELGQHPADKNKPDEAGTEPYEGMLVEVQNVEVETAPDSRGAFTLKGGVVVDRTLFTYAANKGDTFKSLRGVILYSFDRYRLLPRSIDDITCEGADGKCTPTINTRTVADLQNPASANFVSVNQRAELKGVVVTSPIYAVSANLKGFFVADSAFPGQWGGVLVVVETAFTEALVPGDIVDVVGTKEEFFHNTQFNADKGKQGSVTKTGGGASLQYTIVELTDIPAAPADKSKPDEASKTEPYEGMLIELRDVEVETEPDQRGMFMLKGGVAVDRAIFRHTPKVGDKIAVLRGVILYSFDLYRVLPRSAADIQ